MVQIGLDEAERRRRNLSFHGFRHGLNTALLEAHVPPEKVRTVTGHSSIDMTLLYHHAQVDAMADVRAAQARMLEGVCAGLSNESPYAVPPLLVALLKERAEALRAFIDAGTATYAERMARLPKYLKTVDHLAEAEQGLFVWWLQSGFLVLWSRLVEDFILVGDGPPPAGSEANAVYSWSEIAALKGMCPEDVAQAHRIKRIFSGTALDCGDERRIPQHDRESAQKTAPLPAVSRLKQHGVQEGQPLALATGTKWQSRR
jgi:hypothetical protein